MRTRARSFTFRLLSVAAAVLGAAAIVAVRAGRGGAEAPPGRYAVGAETVLDNQTGLVWQQPYDPNDRTWTDALAYCEGLSLAGYDDWRLPSYKELLTLVDFRSFSPAIDAAVFPETGSARFWSSSPIPAHTDLAWSVSFVNGEASGDETAVWSQQVRCVR